MDSDNFPRQEEDDWDTGYSNGDYDFLNNDYGDIENEDNENEEVEFLEKQDLLQEEEEEYDENNEEEEECDEKDNSEVGEGEKEEEEQKSRGIVECFNDYLESIFSTYEEYDEEIEEELTAMYVLLWRILSGTVGVIAIIVILTKYPQYLNTLHENQLWFSNIKEVEREISFRTEQGLYYSYYKQIQEASSWSKGVEELLRDNKTEYGRTINILHRFNILPEIFLSALYGWLNPQDPAIIFYVSSVFRLHGMFLAALFMTSWYLSSSCLGGVITSLLFIIHRVDSTRVNYTIPLRESFAVPLLFIQILLLCTVLRSDRWQKVKMMMVFLLTTSFLLCWQFGPFVMLCQLFAIVSLGRIHLIPGNKVTQLILVIGASLFVSCLFQLNPPLVVSSPALSMLVPAVILSTTKAPSKRLGALVRIFVAAAELALMLIATVLISICIKVFLNIDADSHVYQLLLAKLQMGDPRDFDSRLYMCNEAFMYLDMETIQRLTRSGLLPVYAVGIIVFLFSLGVGLFRMVPDGYSSLGETESSKENETDPQLRVEELEQQKIPGDRLQYDLVGDTCQSTDNADVQQITYEGEVDGMIERPTIREAAAEPEALTAITENRPDLVLVLALSIMWSILAFLILRLKVLWLPTVCILSGVFINDCRLYSYLFSKCTRLLSYFPRWFPGFFKVAVSLGFGAYVLEKYWEQIYSELWPEEVYEFWDPDTVELMEWIQQHTPSKAVFAGSMQLLAGVKLCSGRHITNHPHYEDSWLRQRTHEIYQIYGRESAESVHESLRNAGANYIILEDSICLASSKIRQPLCRLTDIIDLHNGHVPADGSHGISGLKQPNHGRFCDIIRFNDKTYAKFFSLVMSNKTFRVYRIAVT